MKAQVIEMLEKSPLWSGLSKQDLKELTEKSEERNYEKGAIIVKKGDRAPAFYLILEGKVEVRLEGKTLSTLGPGQFFGEMSILDSQARTADVVVVEPAKCLVLHWTSFKGLISNNPRIALKVIQELARRLRDTTKTLTE
ncbi:MAG TPA: cyclic nucleotide-binding domain-containing protein [Candidatus Bathyarchaeia archaeon]|nr:cyclic nucleotide-binding domain-containing protein [Candidatus Bathyarchaeia archaeon]